jgi:hypothetical protein
MYLCILLLFTLSSLALRIPVFLLMQSALPGLDESHAAKLHAYSMSQPANQVLDERRSIRHTREMITQSLLHELKVKNVWHGKTRHSRERRLASDKFGFIL